MNKCVQVPNSILDDALHCDIDSTCCSIFCSNFILSCYILTENCAATLMFLLLLFFVYIHTYLYILYLCVFHFQLFCSGILIASLKHRLATGMLVCIHPCKYFMLSLIEGCRSDVLMFYILLITVVYIYRQIVYV